MKLDLRKFNLKARATKLRKVAAQQLNAGIKKIGSEMGAAIPPVPPARIKADLMRDPHLLAALTSNRLAKKGIGILQPPEFGRAMRRFRAFKMASSGYMRSPWQQMADRRGKRFLGITVRRVLATASKPKIEMAFTMAWETGMKRKTAKARFVQELQPILDKNAHGISAETMLRGWKS